MSDLNALRNAVLTDSNDESARWELRAALSAAGCWERREVFAFVLASPEADGPRLLAADWLADDAQWERAEFIRAQCALSRLVDVHGAGASARPEAAELLGEQRRIAVAVTANLTEGLIRDPSAVWTVDGDDGLRVRGDDVALVFHRGFAAQVELTTPTFLSRAAEFFRAHPVTSVQLTDKTPAPVREGYWWWDSCLAPSVPACLARYIPPELYGHLARTVPPAELTFPTLAAAYEALSRACVSYGRNLAGQEDGVRHRLPQL